MNKLLLSAAVAGVLTATAAIAQDNAAPAADAAAKVKCLGIAKAGKNDCKNAAHSCAGVSKTDNDPTEWVFAASADECTKAGGKVAEEAAAAPAAEAPKAN